MFSNDALTETGILALFGILTGFLIKCCQEIQNSRCDNIKFCGFECTRQVLSEDYVERLRKENRAAEEKKAAENEDTDNNV